MKRKDEAMYAWLKTRGAVLNWQERIGDGRISIVCFTIRGRIMLQMVYFDANDHDDFIGYDVFVPVTDSNDEAQTIEALKERYK